MIFSRRRMVTLSALATLIIGTAIASNGVAWLTPSSRVSAYALLEKAEASRRQRPSPSPDTNQPSSDPQTESSGDGKSNRREFTVYRDATGQIACREATPAEIAARARADLQNLGLRQINHLQFDKSASSQAPHAANLTIILRATQQLLNNADATAAFNRAAQNWENVIMSPVTIYIDVDFGATNFGQSWPAGVLGSTRSPSSSYPYQSVRASLNAEATGEGNPTKQGIFNTLPLTTVPTDLGDANAVDVSDSQARAIGLLPATAQPNDPAARIAFNSNNMFDFDPTDGIMPNQIDFDAVATHEIGHALGFDSDAGENFPKPSVWDLYRFRTGTTTSMFAAAQRILTIGGSPDSLQYDFIPGNPELGLSTGGPTGSTSNNGDGWQSSHWKHVSTCGGTIGIMDPAIPDGCRRTITSNDVLALGSFGYNLTNSTPPPPPPPAPTPPPNDNFANAQTITGCSGSVSGSTFGATAEAGEPSHDPPDSTSLSPSHTIWYQWQAPSTGSTTITTSGSDFDTILAVYTGNSVPSLTQVVFNDDVQDGVIRTSSVTFPATIGTTYSIAVDGWGGDAGTVKLNWTGCVATPTPTPTPTPTATPTPTPSPTATPVLCPINLSVNSAGDAPDSNPGDGLCTTSSGSCSLRAALQEANALPACPPIGINLSAVPGGITLSTALPDINHNVNLNGPGIGQQIVQRSAATGTPNFRIFTISSGRTVGIFQITISNGNATGFSTDGNGGGIFNNGTLTLINSNVYGNSSLSVGGGVYHAGPLLTMINCNVGGTGVGQPNSSGANGATAGVQAAGPIVINGGSISGNAGGAGIGIGATATLNSVNISNNNNKLPGGGIAVFNGASANILNCLIANNVGGGGGGGVNNGVGTVKIINTTISGNSGLGGQGGGVNNFNGTLTMNNVTITNNRAGFGGGLDPAGPVLMSNTIIAGNFLNSTATPDDVNGSAVNSSSSFNIIGSCLNNCGLSNGVNNNQVGATNAGLGPLTFNGGQLMTHALLVGSPAINAGSNALALDQNGNALTTDQRGVGFPRVFNGTVDIGAYEAGNPIDEASFFVKQQYFDFLNRQPDQSGWDFWAQQITSCGNDVQCIQVKRINTSGAFFLSIEFQQTGNLVYKMYKAGFGNLQGKPVAVDRAPFLADTRQIQSTPVQIIVGQGNWQAQLEANKQAFALAFVQRSQFQAMYASMTASNYVAALFANAGVTPTAAETTAAINAFNGAGGGDAGRAAALRSVAESNSVSNILFNEAFVLMQYFGYLQRNPYDPPESTLDYSGYNFWLNKLNAFNGDYIAAEMVKAFISSAEYRQRFGPP
jgi:CSLREA domain-containing protein